MSPTSYRAAPPRGDEPHFIGGAGWCQPGASHQNFGYRERGRTSEVTVTHSEPREEPVTRPSLREYAVVQRARYLSATRTEKGALLDEVVAVTGLHRKAAIRLLRRPPHARAGRAATARPWPKPSTSCGRPPDRSAPSAFIPAFRSCSIA